MATKQMKGKIFKAWKKWNDKAVGKEEKATIKATIDKMLAKHNLSLDWTNGKITEGKADSQKADSQKKEEKKADSQKESRKEKTEGKWTTKDLAWYISKKTGKDLTPKQLRRHLRKNWYNDGKTTHYAWNGESDQMVKTILQYFKEKSA